MKRGDIVRVIGSHSLGTKNWNQKAEEMKGEQGIVREVENCPSHPDTIIVLMDKSGRKEYFDDVHLTVVRPAPEEEEIPFGQRLWKVRKAMNCLQGPFAEFLGISRKRLSDLENGAIPTPKEKELFERIIKANDYE